MTYPKKAKVVQQAGASNDPFSVCHRGRVMKRIHAKWCSGRLKVRWSGMSCDCGARMVCY